MNERLDADKLTQTSAGSTTTRAQAVRGRWPRFGRSIVLIGLALAGVAGGWQVHFWWTGTESLEAIEPLIARQDWARAERLLNRYLARHPADPPATMLLGRVLAGRGAYMQCAELLEQVPAASQQYVEALFRAGQAWHAAHLRRQAERVWTACRALDPNSSAALYYQQECRRELCGIYALEQRRAEFMTLSWEMMEQEAFARRHDILFARTRFEFEKIDPQVALTQLQSGLAADPNDMFSRRAMGLYHLEAGQMQEARAQLFQCVQQVPEEWLAWEAWLKCLYSAGDLNGLAEAVDQMPGRFLAPDFRSLVAEQQGAIGRARELARQCITAEPGKAESHYRLSQLEARAGNEAEAQEHRARSNELKKAMDNLHDLYDAYRDLRARTPQERAELAARFGQSYENLGNRAEAMAWYRSALAEDSRNETSSVRLQRLESGQDPQTLTTTNQL